MRDPKVEGLFGDISAALDVLDGRANGISSIAKCQAARDALESIRKILDITERERNLHRREVEHLQIQLNRRSLMIDPTKEDYEKFHEVLKKAREQAMTSSDLDILHRFGYWEAVQDHSHALRSKDYWHDTAEGYKKALQEIIKKLDQDPGDSDCEGNACDALRMARQALRSEGDSVQFRRHPVRAHDHRREGMTAQELVSKVWQIGLMDPMTVRMENAIAMVEKYGEERWQAGYNLGWKHCDDGKAWDRVRANL